MSELTLEIVLRSIFGTDLDRLTQQLGGNPFEVVTKESGRNLQFAFKFRSLTKLVAELIARRRTEGTEHFDFLAMLMSARDKDTGEAMPRARAHRRGHDADRRRTRDHRQRAQLDLVPVVAAPASRRAAARRDRRRRGYRRTEPGADGGAHVHAAR